MISAGYSCVCACGARIMEGDPVGWVDGEWCCEQCVQAFGEDPWPSENETEEDEARAAGQ